MTDTLGKTNQPVAWIRVADLVVKWPEAQRKLGEKRAKQIAENFDPDLLGVLCVSAIEGGKYHINDGQTRATAIRIWSGDENQRVPCSVIPAGDAKRAAQIFSAMNGMRTKPTAMEIFKTDVTGEVASAVTVNSLVRRAGLRIDDSDADGCIRAVSAVLSIYKQFGEQGLATTLDAIKVVWKLEHAAFDAYIMRGFALFLAQSEIEIDPVRLSKRVIRKFTPGKLLGSAKATKEAFGGNLTRAIAALVKEAYGTPRAPAAPKAEPAPPPKPAARPRRRHEPHAGATA